MDGSNVTPFPFRSLPEPPTADPYELPAPTAAEIIQEDADRWNEMPVILRRFAAALWRLKRIEDLTVPDSYIARQARVLVRHKIPEVRAYLDQLEAELGEDPEAEASLMEDGRDEVVENEGSDDGFCWQCGDTLPSHEIFCAQFGKARRIQSYRER